MKKLLVLLLPLLFISCAQIADNMTDIDLSIKASGHSLYYSDDFNNISSYSDIDNWIGKNITYKSESSDVWQNPEETIKKGYGDCEDFAILYMNILYVRFGIKAVLVICDSDKMTARTVVDGGEINHAILYFAGKYIDPQTGNEYRLYKVGYKYTFSEVF